MDISLPQGGGREGRGWRPQQIDIRKLAFDKLGALFRRHPAPLPDWLAAPPERSPRPARQNQPGTLLGRARIESKWFELVWDGLSARNGTLDGELTPSTWQLNTLASELPMRAPQPQRPVGQGARAGEPPAVAGQAADLERVGQSTALPCLACGQGGSGRRICRPTSTASPASRRPTGAGPCRAA